MTILLPTTPLCVTLDPADRAAYIGYEDGSIQLFDFYKEPSPTQQILRADHATLQTVETDRWRLPSQMSSKALCIQVSYDGTMILSGHQDGKVLAWAVGSGKYKQQLADFGAPVTNLVVLPPEGFLNPEMPDIKLHEVTKPRYFDLSPKSVSRHGVPKGYTYNCEFLTEIPLKQTESGRRYEEEFNHPAFPDYIIDEIITMSKADRDSPYPDPEITAKIREKNKELERLVKESNERLQARDAEDKKRQQDDLIKAERKKKRRLRRARAEEIERKKEMREPVGDADVEMEGDAEKDEKDLSSDTDELTDDD